MINNDQIVKNKNHMGLYKNINLEVLFSSTYSFQLSTCSISLMFNNEIDFRLLTFQFVITTFWQTIQ